MLFVLCLIPPSFQLHMEVIIIKFRMFKTKIWCYFFETRQCADEKSSETIYRVVLFLKRYRMQTWFHRHPSRQFIRFLKKYRMQTWFHRHPSRQFIRFLKKYRMQTWFHRHPSRQCIRFLKRNRMLLSYKPGFIDIHTHVATCHLNAPCIRAGILIWKTCMCLS